MNQQQSKSKLQPIKYTPPERPKSIGTLNEQEAYDKFGSARIDGLKIVSIEDSTVTPNGHIVAFFKGIKVLIPIRQ